MKPASTAWQVDSLPLSHLGNPCCCCCCCLVTSVVSNSVRPHRRQPTRLPHPWDSPGKNTGVGCHFLLQCMKVKSEREVAQPCPTLRNPMDFSLPGSSIHGIFQARVLEWVAIQGIFPPQGSILGLPHSRQTLYYLSHHTVSALNHYYIFSRFHQMTKDCGSKLFSFSIHNNAHCILSLRQFHCT